MPPALPDLTPPTDIEIITRRTAFQGYFRIDEYTMRHGRFDGGWTKPLKREVFERGHAAALLPYDPERDCFVLCQQFRIGAYAGGMNPWQIECVAGIIESGETPEDVARRETEEECGCVARDLIPIQQYLVSPGGASETATLYLGRVSAAKAGGIFGLENEGEHIRVFTATSAQLREFLDNGKLGNAITLIAAQWFFLNQDRVRAAWGDSGSLTRGETMSPYDTDALVTTDWLAEHMGHPGLRIVDASYFVPGGVAPAREQFLDAHIPGAQFFDINAIADVSNPKEHAFPSPQDFAARVGELGIGNGHRVIAYDHMGGACAAARVWFLFRAFGHAQVSVLSGGRSAWLAEKRPIETGAALSPARQRYQASEPLMAIRRRADMEDNIARKAFQVLDARAAARFTGGAPEPRPGLRAGHIPGSRNLPFLDLFDQTTMTFKPPAQLREVFANAGIDLSAPLTTTCGSGVSACALALGAYLIGKIDVQIYDGSWLEWGGDASLPIETGNPRP